MSQKALVTGGLGTVGFFLSKALAEKGYSVTIIDDFSKKVEDEDVKVLLKMPNVEVIKADLTDKKFSEKIIKTYDFVYHLAAINGTKYFYEKPHEVLRVNTLTALNILEWFKKQGTGKILFTSSNEAYASTVNKLNGPIPTSEDIMLSIDDTYNPRWSYGGSKLIGELFFINYAKMFNFQMTIIRYHNSYGPRMGFAHVIPDFIMRFLEKKDVFDIYGGEETRAFCYIEDTIEQTILAMEERRCNNETIHVGNPDEIKIKELAKKIGKIMQMSPKYNLHPAPEGSVKRRCPDISKIKRLTGYKGPKVSLDDGLKRTIDWYQNLKNIKN